MSLLCKIKLVSTEKLSTFYFCTDCSNHPHISWIFELIFENFDFSGLRTVREMPKFLKLLDQTWYFGKSSMHWIVTF